MINYKNLSMEQIIALYLMGHFDCAGIECDDCPLYSPGRVCGSCRASNIIDDYEKEIQQ